MHENLRFSQNSSPSLATKLFSFFCFTSCGKCDLESFPTDFVQLTLEAQNTSNLPVVLTKTCAHSFFFFFCQVPLEVLQFQLICGYWASCCSFNWCQRTKPCTTVLTGPQPVHRPNSHLVNEKQMESDFEAVFLQPGVWRKRIITNPVTPLEPLIVAVWKRH